MLKKIRQIFSPKKTKTAYSEEFLILYWKHLVKKGCVGKTTLSYHRNENKSIQPHYYEIVIREENKLCFFCEYKAEKVKNSQDIMLVFKNLNFVCGDKNTSALPIKFFSRNPIDENVSIGQYVERLFDSPNSCSTL